MASTGFTRPGGPNQSAPEASPPSTPARRRREITLRLRIGLPFIYARRLTRILVLAAVLADLCIAFRIWIQVRGVEPHGLPETLVYSLGTVLVEPFRKFDTGPSIKDTAILDFAALVAFDFFFAAALALLASGWLLALATRLVERWAPVIRLDLLRLQAAIVAYWRSVRTDWSNANRSLSDALDRGISYVWTRDWAGYKSSVVRRWRSLQAAWSKTDRALGVPADTVTHWLWTRDWAGYVAAAVRTYHTTIEVSAALYRSCAYWAGVTWADSVRIAAGLRLLTTVGVAGIKDDVERLPQAILREMEASRLRLGQETDWWAVRAALSRRLGLKSASSQRPGSEPAFTHLSRRDFFRRIARVFGPTV